VLVLRIAMVGLISLLVGAGLATGTGVWPVRPGLIGLSAMLVSGLVVKRHWQRLRAVGADPGSPERALWHGLATTALVGGHLFASLWYIGPAMRLHSPLVHDMAIDNWTMVLGALLSYGLTRDREPRRDERDRLFAARGQRAGYIALIGQALGLSLVLGYGAGTVVERLSQAMVSHLLISTLILAAVVQYAAQLRLYMIDDQHALTVS